jgi:RNA-directed DNA polymerase
MSGDVHVRFRERLRGRFLRATRLVVCFQAEAEAKRFRQEMESRLNQFGLDIAPEKTRCIEFGANAVKRAKVTKQKVATFDFLGFTHYCSHAKDGKRFRMKRKTISKRLTVKLKAFKVWLKKNKTLSTPEVMRTTAKKLQGHYGYYGVTDNLRGIRGYYQEVRRILLEWLNRRGKRTSYNLEKFAKLLTRYPLPKPRIMVNLLY